MINSMGMSKHLNPIGNTAIIALAAFVILSQALASSTVETGPSPSPTPPPNCIELLLNISDCLRYLESGSNVTEPDKGCCPELAGLLETNPICLCQLLGSPHRKTGLRIQFNKALQLPSLCNLHSPPPITFCQDAGIPVGSPIATEGPSPTSPSDMASEGLAASSHNSGLNLAITSLSLFTSLASAIFFLRISSD